MLIPCPRPREGAPSHTSKPCTRRRASLSWEVWGTQQNLASNAKPKGNHPFCESVFALGARGLYTRHTPTRVPTQSLCDYKGHLLARSCVLLPTRMARQELCLCQVIDCPLVVCHFNCDMRNAFWQLHIQNRNLQNRCSTRGAPFGSCRLKREA